MVAPGMLTGVLGLAPYENAARPSVPPVVCSSSSNDVSCWSSWVYVSSVFMNCLIEPINFHFC